MDNMTVSPFVSAEAYAVGNRDGLKAGFILGAVTVMVIRGLAKRNKNRALLCKHDCKHD